MKRRRKKLQEMQVRLPVHHQQPRTPEYDKLALRVANELSATPVKRVQFVGKTMSGLSRDIEHLVYICKAVPKDVQ